MFIISLSREEQATDTMIGFRYTTTFIIQVSNRNGKRYTDDDHDECR